jgi:hypothetical protein
MGAAQWAALTGRQTRFHEFAETGVNERLGFSTSADLVERYPAFFWDQVASRIEPAVRHLNVIMEGRRWIACAR